VIELHAVEGLPEVVPGDDLAALIAERARLRDGDILVVAQKVVSKAEGRLRDMREITPSGQALEIARRNGSDPRQVQAVIDESVRLVRTERVVIAETRHGFVCANAGVDFSNVATGTAALLPLDPDRSARHIREALEHRHQVSVGVIISDTFGRTWRQGVTDVAIGIAGIAGIVDLRGTQDATGRVLDATEICVADELAGAAELVMGKARGVPAAVLRGVDPGWLRPASVAAEIVRPPAEDLFR
jgi:coenzyme F420-0:L-glutamate ligase/coenzyme F420-1:gamma-L-glutamate ligase